MIDLTTLAAAKAYTDKKFAGGGLPVVEITSAEYPVNTENNIDDDSPVWLSSDENTAFNEAFETGLPPVIKFTFAGNPFAGTATRTIFEGFNTFSLQFQGIDFNFIGVEGTWGMVPVMVG